MPTFIADRLFEIGRLIFTAGGVPHGVATQVVESLVLSNLLGVDSHGIVRIRDYFDSIKRGAIVPDAQPRLLRDGTVAALMDGNRAFGQIVARQAMQLAIEKAKAVHIGVTSFTNVYHIGRLGEYADMAAEQGFIGLVFANGSRPGGLVAPFGARQRVLGTNPIAFAVPAGCSPSMSADFSTAAVAEGRVRIALRKGEKIPFGWIIDREGRPTDNPADLYDGGAILPAGDHKGFALSLLVEVIGGILSGGDTPIFPHFDYMHNGVFMLVIKPGFFRPPDEYRASVDFLFSAVKRALPAPDTDGALIPGEPERQVRAIREQKGIPIDDQTWNEILEVAAQYNVTINRELSQELPRRRETFGGRR